MYFVAHQMMEAEHYVFLKGHGSHIIKTLFPKSEPMQSLMTSYFQNGRLIKKKTRHTS